MVPFFYAESLLRMLSDGAAKGGLEAYFKDHPDELDKIIEVTLPQINSRNATGPVRQCAGAYATLAYSLKGDWTKTCEKGALGTFDYAGGTVKLEIVYRNGIRLCEWWKNAADRNRWARTGAECGQERALAVQRHVRAPAFAEGPVPLKGEADGEVMLFAA